LHDHLLEQQLSDYARSRGDVPLFYHPGRSRSDKSANRNTRRQSDLHLGSADSAPMTKTSPEHGCRHRFSTLARAVDMNTDVQNIIQGHAGDKSSSNYKDASI
jgi:hypothetical protein